MISEPTQQQLAALRISNSKPLLICDVDEVVVHFVRDFEDFIDSQNLALTPGDPTKPYIVKARETQTIVPTEKVFALVNDFFELRTKFMQPIEGALEELEKISQHASIVLLTNMPHFAGPDRRANLQNLGLDFPVITNSGPKGPAISELASRTQKPVVFIDDSANFIQSAFDHAPHVHLIHFLHDDRFSVHVPELDFVALRGRDWPTVSHHAHKLLTV